MRQRSLLLLFLVVALVLAGCGTGPAVQPTQPEASTGQVFQVALPRLVVDVDAEGNPSVLGINPALLSAFGVDTSAMKIPPETVAQMTKAGIQHIEVASVGDRIMFFVNGKPLPHVGWTAESLPRALDVADVFLNLQNSQMIRQLLPLVTRLGLDIVLRFPTQEGAAEIPMADPNAAKASKPTPSTEPPSMIIQGEVTFDEQGRMGLLGMSAEDLATMGMQPITLPAETLAEIQKANLQTLEFKTGPEGATIYANGEPLPTFMWDSQLLANLMEVVRALAADSPLLPLLEQLVPYVDRANIDIMIHFPVAEGQEPIPAQMHG